MRVLVDVLTIAAAATSWAVSRRDHAYKLVAAFLTWMAATNLLRSGLVALRTGAPKPYQGLHLGLLLFDRLLVLSWWFLPLALALHYFAKRRVTAAVAAWFVAWVPLLHYPEVSGELLASIIRVYAGATLVITWALILHGMMRRDDIEPRLAHLVVMIYAAAEVAIDLVPLAHTFKNHWHFVNIGNVVLYTVILVLQLGWMVRSRRRALAS